jgi:ATP-binding cassette subfamily B protein
MRHSIILQHDATDCGPAVLSMIAVHYRKRISIARLRELCGTDRGGTTLAGLISAAQQIGFTARGVRATAESLVQAALPAIAHTGNHFVVIYKITSGKIILGDPAHGLRRLSLPDFLKEWSGVLILLRFYSLIVDSSWML